MRVVDRRLSTALQATGGRRAPLDPRRRCWRRSATRSSRRGSRGPPASLPEGLRVVTKRQPTADEWEALRFAWRVCAHVKSNTVIFTDARRTLAIGAGQMSRVDAVNVAVMKARERRAIARRRRSPRRTRSFRSATASTRSPLRARPRSCSPADRCGRRSDRRRRRARPRDGVHRPAALPALKRWDQDTWPQRHKRSQRIIFQEQLSVSSVSQWRRAWSNRDADTV